MFLVAEHVHCVTNATSDYDIRLSDKYIQISYLMRDMHVV
jgi:hypothetical protein